MVDHQHHFTLGSKQRTQKKEKKTRIWINEWYENIWKEINFCTELKIDHEDALLKIKFIKRF